MVTLLVDFIVFYSIHSEIIQGGSGIVLMHSEQLQTCQEISTLVTTLNTVPLNNQILTVISSDFSYVNDQNVALPVVHAAVGLLCCR